MSITLGSNGLPEGSNEGPNCRQFHVELGEVVSRFNGLNVHEPDNSGWFNSGIWVVNMAPSKDSADLVQALHATTRPHLVPWSARHGLLEIPAPMKRDAVKP
jgi:hypothetical protein